MMTTTGEQVLAKVMRWAAESGFETASVSDSRHDFVVEVSESETLPSIQVIHRAIDTAYVLVVGQVRIPEPDRMTLRDLDRERFDELIWTNKLDLLRGGVDFTVLGPEEDPDVWEVQKRLYLDGTGAADFHEAYSKVKNSLIGIIWSYKRALGRAMAGRGTPDIEELISEVGDAEQGQGSRTQRVMNSITNASIILMSALTSGLTKAMMETTGAAASGMAEAMAGEEAGDEVRKEFEEKVPEVDDRIRELISEVRRDVYDQIAEKRKEIEPLISDSVFDVGPQIVDGYDFGLPKLTEELGDEALARYSQLLVSEDPSFSEMFKELVSWMNTLPKMPEKGEDE